MSALLISLLVLLLVGAAAATAAAVFLMNKKPKSKYQYNAYAWNKYIPGKTCADVGAGCGEGVCCDCGKSGQAICLPKGTDCKLVDANCGFAKGQSAIDFQPKCEPGANWARHVDCRDQYGNVDTSGQKCAALGAGPNTQLRCAQK